MKSSASPLQLQRRRRRRGGLAGIAAAAPTGGGNAGDAMKELQAAGYNVQINGSLTDPLSACVTTGVHGTPTTAGLPGPSLALARSRPSTSTSRVLILMRLSDPPLATANRHADVRVAPDRLQLLRSVG